MKFEFGKFEINFKQIIVSNHIIFYRVLFNMKNNLKKCKFSLKHILTSSSLPDKTRTPMCL